MTERIAHLTCFAPNCGAIATHGKYCGIHRDFDRILREQDVLNAVKRAVRKGS